MSYLDTVLEQESWHGEALFSQALMRIPGTLKKCVLFNDDMSQSFLLLGRKAATNLNSILKKQRHYFAN